MMTYHREGTGTGRCRTLACLGAAMLAACGVSQQQEVEMGASNAAQIDTMLPLVRDAAINSYINTLGNELAHVTDTRNLTWHFTVVDSKEVNAFAIPGGWIYVNRGLIERAQNMSQVAGVLGHEIGHVTLRHTVEQMQQQQEVGMSEILACTLTKVCQGATATAVDVANSALFARFSRTDEAEADAEGVKTTIRAGIDPRGIPEMFHILLEERKSNPSAVDAFFASHPLEEARIQATQDQIAQYPADKLKGLTKDTPEFQAFRSRLQSLPPSPPPPKGK
jgi:predicted Zn-dependent protease